MNTIKAILLGLILTSLTSMAGIEDHLYNQVCYKLQSNLASTPLEIPREICVEAVSIDIEKNKINVLAYFQQEYFNNMTLTSLTRKNEDHFNFKASSVLKDEWQSGCESGEKIELFISGLAEVAGEADIYNLKIELVHEYTHDTCHSDTDIQKFEYTRN